MENRLDVLEAWVEDPGLVENLQQIEQQRKRMISCWRAAPYAERDEAFLKRYMYQAQYDMVLMLDSLFARNADTLDRGLKRVLSALMACLEALLDFIERHRPQYFNRNQQLPECIRVRKGLEKGRVLPEGCTYGKLYLIEQEGMPEMEPAWNPDMPEEMGEMDAHEQSRYDKQWKTFKMLTLLKASELGLLLGTLMHFGVLAAPQGLKQKMVYIFFGQHVRTSRTEQLSWMNLQNHGSSKDLGVLRMVRKLCHQMLKHIDEMIEKVLNK